MTFTFFFAAIMVISTIIALIVGIYTWRQKTIPGARMYALVAFALFIWSLFTFFEVLSRDYLTIKIFRNLQHIGKTSLPSLWFLFTLCFTQPDIRLSRKLLAAVTVLPFISLGLVFTDPWHGLIWGNSAFNSQPIPHLELEQGLWFRWVLMPHAYFMFLLGLGALLNGLTNSSKRYRHHVITLLTAFLIPFGINVAHILGGLSSYGLDPTPLGIALSSLLIAIRVFRGNFFNSHPISYRTIFLNIAEAVLVLDNNGRVVERNPAGEVLTPLASVDQPLSEVLPVHHKVLTEVSDVHADGDMDITTVLEHPPQHFSELKLRPLKTVDGQALGAALIIRDVTLEKAQQARLENAAFIDALTGIYNRARFEQLANMRIQESTPDDVIALLYIDLDKFKPVNDTYGHQAGDQVLQAVAQRLQYSVREQDLVARLGGDEFAVLLVSSDPNMAAQTKLRIQQVLSQPVYLRHGDVLGDVSSDIPVVTSAPSDGLEMAAEISVNIGASIGVAYYPQDGTSFEALLEHADHAMYSVKRPR